MRFLESRFGPREIPAEPGAESHPEGRMAAGRQILAAVPLASLYVGTLLLAAIVVLHLPTLGQPLIEVHAFRQTQTAWTAVIFHQEGIDLLRPQLPVLGPPFVVPLEFPLFQAAASLVMDAGVPPDVALRVTGLFTFVLTAVLLWRLVARLAGDSAGLVALIAFSVSPLGLLWSRTSMIEYLATAGAVGALYGALRWQETSSKPWYVASLVAGAVAMLVKPPTAVLYLLPLVVLGIQGVRDPRRPTVSARQFALAAAGLILVPVAIGMAWTLYADAIKAASPNTTWLTSAAIVYWNFGTIGQRLDPYTWWVIGRGLSSFLLGHAAFIWLPLAFLGCLALARRWFVMAWLMGAAFGPLIFVNLYAAHDYYLIAISPMAALAVALSYVWLRRMRRQLLALLIAIGLVGAWVFGLTRTAFYWGAQFEAPVDSQQQLIAGEFIAAHSRPDEIVVLLHRDWDPAALYYAQRKGLQVYEGRGLSVKRALSSPILQDLRSIGYTKLFACPYSMPCIAGYDLTVDPPRRIPNP